MKSRVAPFVPLAEATLPQTSCLLPPRRVFASTCHPQPSPSASASQPFCFRSPALLLPQLCQTKDKERETERARQRKRERERESGKTYVFGARLSRGSSFKPKPQSRKLAEAIFLKKLLRKQKHWRAEACGSVSRKEALFQAN